MPKRRGASASGANPNLFPRLTCGHIARFRQGVAESDVAFKTAVEVAWRISRAGTVERRRRVQDHVIRVGALIDGGGKDKRLERRASLPLRLRCAVEFG